MFKLPVCPHCGAVYRYGDTRKAVKSKINECYHCKKSFRVRILPYALVMALPLTAICVAMNIVLLSRMKQLSLLPLFAVTIAFLLIIWALIPFFLKFKKTDDTNKVKNNKKMNK